MYLSNYIDFILLFSDVKIETVNCEAYEVSGPSKNVTKKEFGSYESILSVKEHIYAHVQ